MNERFTSPHEEFKFKNDDYTVEYDGRVYAFATPDEKAEFIADHELGTD